MRFEDTAMEGDSVFIYCRGIAGKIKTDCRGIAGKK